MAVAVESTAEPSRPKIVEPKCVMPATPLIVVSTVPAVPVVVDARGFQGRIPRSAVPARAVGRCDMRRSRGRDNRRRSGPRSRSPALPHSAVRNVVV